ncbi:MAG: lysophospholipase L1-like esterase/glucose/arabinose dehydrogenase [Rhodothermales bacterium]|jgi:lysophospholipase L1-like esterase/glucose/arabinose dehydrogenase
MSTRSVVLLFSLLLSGLVRAADLPLEKGDHICFIGNGLADRMQHSGWFETYVQAFRPYHELVFRNLGFSGDTIDRQPRHGGFPKQEELLTLCQADVIFLFFGYNESFAESPEMFEIQLTGYIERSKNKDYSGKGAPRLVLVSPIAHENLKSANLPDGAENNIRLESYTDAMRDTAATHDLPFIDLFSASKALYETSAEPLTINGVHLNEKGNQAIAGLMFEALFKQKPSAKPAINAAVVDKNWHWFNRHRATDGNDVWGGRSGLRFNNQTNKDVLQHELVIWDAMTANRDKAIWATARGGAATVDDSSVPKPLAVATNRKGPGENHTHTFISGEEGVSKMKLAPGMQVNLFASEAEFPELVNPVQMAVDTRGRLWVAAWQTYPKWEPGKEMMDTLLILPDEDRDGKADKAIPFARVHNPTAFEFWNGGVLVASAPEIIFLRDTDGDDRADERIVMLQGIDSADTHHTANCFVYGPDGGIYYQRGVFHVSNVETPWGRASYSTKSGMYRFNPRTHEFGFHVSNAPNPHGISFDYWGYNYITEGTGGSAHQVVPNGGGGFTKRKLLQQRVRPVPSSGILSSAHFPPENEGNFLICNSIAFLGIKQYTLSFDEGMATGTETHDLLISGDSNFRPTDIEVGGDGALYISDWSNPIIGHMQHNIRDPSRDHKHGRVYRMTAIGRPLQEHVEIDGAPIAALLENLKHPVNGVRYRTRIELSERDTAEVVAAADTWIEQFELSSEEDAHHLLEALWLYQQHNVKNRELLEALLTSPEEHARIAAATVRQFWDAVPAAAEKLVPATGTAKNGGKLAASRAGTSREEFDKVFDQETSTKWYVSDSPAIWISYTYADGAGHRVSSYSISSANDTPERDPKDWRLFGSTDGKKWIEVDGRSGEKFSARHQTRRFDVAKPGAYSSYKLLITRNNGAGGTQLSEIELIE